MPWTPPAGVIPTDRKSPSVPTMADIPAMLDWLRDFYPGNTVIGVLATARAERMTYRVDGEPGYGTPGTLSNYVLTKLDWDRDVIDAALADIPDQVATGLAPIDAALNQVADIIAATAQSEAQILAANGRIAWAGGDETTLPSGAGDYLLTRGAAAGQVWSRATPGAPAARNYALETPDAGRVTLALRAGDTATARRTALQAAITDAAAQRRILRVTGSGDSSLDATLDLPDYARVTFDPGVRLTPTGDFPVFRAAGSFGVPVNLTADLQPPSVPTANEIVKQTVTVTSTAGFTAGGYAVLLSNAVDGGTQYNTKRGLMTHVRRILSSTQLEIDIGPQAGLPFLVSEFARLVPATLRRGIVLEFPEVYDPAYADAPDASKPTDTTRTAAAISLALCEYPTLRGAFVHDWTQTAVQLLGCYGAWIHDTRVADLGDGATGRYGYGVAVQGVSTNIHVIGLDGRNARHLFTTVQGHSFTNPTTGTADLYGIPGTAYVQQVSGDSISGGALDTHGEGYYVEFAHCRITNSNNGINARARTTVARDVEIIGGQQGAAQGAACLEFVLGGVTFRDQASVALYQVAGGVVRGRDVRAIGAGIILSTASDLVDVDVSGIPAGKFGLTALAGKHVMRGWSVHDNAGTGVRTRNDSSVEFVSSRFERNATNDFSLESTAPINAVLDMHYSDSGKQFAGTYPQAWRVRGRTVRSLMPDPGFSGYTSGTPSEYANVANSPTFSAVSGPTYSDGVALRITPTASGVSNWRIPRTVRGGQPYTLAVRYQRLTASGQGADILVLDASFAQLGKLDLNNAAAMTTLTLPFTPGADGLIYLVPEVSDNGAFVPLDLDFLDLVEGTVDASYTPAPLTPLTSPSVAALKTAAGAAQGQRAQTLGHATPGDGGGATWLWMSADTRADNGWSVLQVSGVTTGRWVRQAGQPVNLSQTTTTAAASNMVLGLSSSLAMIPGTTYAVRATVQAQTASGASAAAWQVTGAIVRGASGGPALMGTPTVTLLGSTGTVSGWAVALVATGSALAVQVTGAAATTIKWAARLDLVELTS